MNCTRPVAVLLTVIWAVAVPNGQSLRPALPVEPVRAVLTALESHQVVGLGLGAHNNEQGHAFLLTLLRHAEFSSTATDVAVECGNARYQTMMDRFIDGDEVPYESLRRAWQNTTQSHAGCDTPIHEELFRTVRSVNGLLPATRRSRVLLGDPPVDWDSSSTKQDRDKFMTMRESHPAQIIQKEVLAKGRHALVVYGQMHLQRKQIATNYEMSDPLAQTIVSLLEREGVNVFTVWGNSRADIATLQPSVADWPRPSITMLRGTALGAADFEFFYGSPIPRSLFTEGKLSPLSREQWRGLRMQDQFDALLYLGPPSSMTTAVLASALCADAEYMKMRLGRLDAVGPKVEADGLRAYCANALKR
jgi:hypothetical protein